MAPDMPPQALDNNWAQLSPEQKREQRFNWWRSSSEEIKFISPEAEKAYKLRIERLINAYKVQEPDRVPVVLPIGALPLYLYGTDYYTAMYDYDKASEAYNQFNNEYSTELDCFTSPNRTLPGKIYDILDYKLYAWPGHSMPKTAKEFQFMEGEYMKADEYNALIKDPSDFWMRTYLPRVFGSFEPFRSFSSLTDIIEIPTAQLMPLAMPEVQATLQKLIDAGQELSGYIKTMKEFDKKGLEMGFPVQHSMFAKAPFDTLGDTMRGTQGIMKDMYRQPDKLLEAMDLIAELAIDSVLKSDNSKRGLFVGFPLHKGADGWMSQKQFETFYWPPLKIIINAFINEGLIAGLFAEGSFNTRLEYINEFPKGAIHWMFDQTDMTRAKQILGDKCSISGNVPASMMVTGSPEEVKKYCRELIEVCGKGGGYVLSGGVRSVTESKLDNIRAMMAAVKEYGVYKK
ncbi:uroporphyrinogen decarboxylase family protein [Chloroflexota bacterium]